MSRLAHPIPYQGSKRRLAGSILGILDGRRFETLYEPFAGSAALTLAAASRGVADRYVIGDSLAPLAELWERIMSRSTEAADAYARIWRGQFAGDGAAAHFNRIRREYNEDGDPIKLLYLLARCVKNAPRFGRTGAFNQSPDHRRTGMKPEKMRREIEGARLILGGRGEAFAGSAEACIRSAGPDDLVYMDPPWQGTTEGADTRYHQGFARARLEVLIAQLNTRGVPWILSYDGRSGNRTYGEPLNTELWGAHLEIDAGRSSQSTLAGRAEHTVESLYVSADICARLPGGMTGPAEQAALFTTEQTAQVLA